jgi:hypothetical protein
MTEATKKRGPLGTGTSISADLKDYPTVLNKIRAAAKADDRNTSNWLRRRLVYLDEHGQLIPTSDTTAELFDARMIASQKN